MLDLRREHTGSNFCVNAAMISGLMLRACFGQTDMQRMQEMQSVWSVSLGCSIEMAPTGHLAAQSPQATQLSSVIGFADELLISL